MSRPSDLVQGTLDLLPLEILALQPLHGWTIGQRLRQVSGDVLQVSEGASIPPWTSSRTEGSITAEWKATENNRRANCRHANDHAWPRMTIAVFTVVNGVLDRRRHTGPACERRRSGQSTTDGMAVTAHNRGVVCE
jgi:hypothetical protein